ncbi:hypothetical protein [Aequorivita lipolytica]|uniref:DUF541 domain-containing protein n=1 Tax=Aequorivita lipolytica TaxID=153267 RepID=A0A5C6YSN6_9FLAO|nr:hypothetical protein [Aequorivita lipolytica]TXD69978.1 hypothetical protein ESV24_05970 [Aequorivita lipolytica]SRX50197.1 hypothetical protein AEQU2_00666 [Aequorivita lipolytica]
MIQKLLFLFALAFTATSCQFTETMVMNEDGSGTMTVEVNMNEMMAFGGAAVTDSMEVKMDTIVYMKQFLEEKKDSISKLSAIEQEKLKKLENFNIHIIMNSETSEMVYDISTKFKNISEANDILNGLEQASNLMPNMDSNSQETKKEEDSPEIIGVNYSFKKGTFKRDAYIKDKKMHQQQVDSMKQAEAFMGGSNYTLNYTFPKKIKKTSNPEATFSEDKKTVSIQAPFIEYFNNPDLLDLEVELEN